MQIVSEIYRETLNRARADIRAAHDEAIAARAVMDQAIRKVRDLQKIEAMLASALGEEPLSFLDMESSQAFHPRRGRVTLGDQAERIALELWPDDSNQDFSVWDLVQEMESRGLFRQGSSPEGRYTAVNSALRRRTDIFQRIARGRWIVKSLAAQSGSLNSEPETESASWSSSDEEQPQILEEA